MQMIVLKNKVYFTGKVGEVKTFLASLVPQYVTVSQLINKKLH